MWRVFKWGICSIAALSSIAGLNISVSCVPVSCIVTVITFMIVAFMVVAFMVAWLVDDIVVSVPRIRIAATATGVITTLLYIIFHLVLLKNTS